MRIGQFDENYKKKTTPFYEENTSKCLLQLPISAFIKKNSLFGNNRDQGCTGGSFRATGRGREGQE